MIHKATILETNYLNPFFAEVLDKEPWVLSLTLPLLLFAAVAFALSRWHWWLAPVLVPIAAILVWVFTSELTDQFVGPAIWRESPAYFLIVSGAGALALVAPLAGASFALFRRYQRGDE